MRTKYHSEHNNFHSRRGRADSRAVVGRCDDSHQKHGDPAVAVRGVFWKRGVDLSMETKESAISNVPKKSCIIVVGHVEFRTAS